MSSIIAAALSGGASLTPGSISGQLGNLLSGGNNAGSGAANIPTGSGGGAVNQGYTGVGSKVASGVVNSQGAQAANSVYGPWESRQGAVGGFGSQVGAMPAGSMGMYRKSSNSPLNTELTQRQQEMRDIINKNQDSGTGTAKPTTIPSDNK